MSLDDETQQPAAGGLPAPSKRPRAWMRWIGAASRQAERAPGGTPEGAEPVNVTLRSLSGLLDSSSLPDGVVELVIEDFEAPNRQLLDIHDGRITLVEPGQCVPWASISGPPTAWALALGPERNTAALRLSGDESLARRVLAALPRPG